MPVNADLDALAVRLRVVRHLVVLTGAGISAESGIPTFRDAQTGLWARYRAEDLATPEAFARDPALVWRWYLWRRRLVETAAPNAGHLALVTLEQRVARFTLITQNVDGLHRRAGSADPIELHGCLLQARRMDGGEPVEFAPSDDESPPRSAETDELLRPNVVWFGESLPREPLARAEAAATDCDLMLVVGTSALVQPAAGLPLAALQAGAFVVEVNPQATPLSAHVSMRLAGNAAEVLPALLEAAWPAS